MVLEKEEFLKEVLGEEEEFEKDFRFLFIF